HVLFDIAKLNPLYPSHFHTHILKMISPHTQEIPKRNPTIQLHLPIPPTYMNTHIFIASFPRQPAPHPQRQSPACQSPSPSPGRSPFRPPSTSPSQASDRATQHPQT